MGEMIVYDDSMRAGGVGFDEDRIKGHIPRDFKYYPVGSVGARFDASQLIPENEIAERIRIQEADKSSLEHLMRSALVKSLNQNGQGYCWAYSTTTATMVSHLVANNKYVPLSGHMIGCLVKGYRDQGGWNGESLAFACANGIATQADWPEDSMSRSNDTPTMRANAKQFMVTEWTDLDDSGSAVKIQLASLLLQNIPVMVDFNWWSHSVCAVRLMSWQPFRIRIRNSWGDSWSDQGYGDLEGSRAIPNGAACPRVTPISA